MAFRPLINVMVLLNAVQGAHALMKAAVAMLVNVVTGLRIVEWGIAPRTVCKPPTILDR